MSAFFTKLTAWLIGILNIFLSLLGRPIIAQTIDMDKFDPEPAFCDEFDGDGVDLSYWNLCSEPAAVRRGGYWSGEMVRVENGCLHIRTAYIPQGIDGQPAGWYTGGINSKGKVERRYGYYECRCILPAGEGLWSAFWMLCDSMSDTTQQGLNGEEIDIFEAPHYYNPSKRNMVESALHYDGFGDAHRSSLVGTFTVSGDPYKEFHTYGVEWNEDGYTFYIDGKKTAFSDFGGASRVPEYMILSVEIGGNGGKPAKDWPGRAIDVNGTDFTADFVVDYVKIYQYKQ